MSIRTQDFMSVLVATFGHAATKIVSRTAAADIVMSDYQAGTFFCTFCLPVSSIFELSAYLTQLEVEPNAFVVRGDLLTMPRELGQLVRRTGAGEGNNFIGNFMTPPEGRRWMLIDIDKMHLPSGLKLTQETLPDVLDWVTSQLPPELQSVSFHWQLSSSAGVFNQEQVSIHFWFWLDKPLPDNALKQWAVAFNGGSPTLKIDTALFQHVQAHYTARPIFDGVRDPFPVRSGLLKKPKHSVNLTPSMAKSAPQIRTLRSKSNQRASSGGVGFDAHLASIGDHPGGAGFRQALLSASASYVRSHGTENTDQEALFELLRDAVLKADASEHTPEEIDERASRETIMPMIMSAIAKFGHLKSIGSPNLIHEVAPASRLSGSPISKKVLAAEIDSFFSF